MTGVFNLRYAHVRSLDPNYHYSAPIVFPCKLCKKEICTYSRFGRANNAVKHLQESHADEIKDYDTICPSCLLAHKASPRHKFACSLSHRFPNWEVARPVGGGVRNFVIRIKGKGFLIDGIDDVENEDHIMLYSEEMRIQTREIAVVLSMLRAVAKLDDVRIGGSRKDIDFFKCLARVYDTEGRAFAIIFDKTLFFVYLEVLAEDEVPDTQKSASVAGFLYHAHYDMSDAEYPTDMYDDSGTDEDF